MQNRGRLITFALLAVCAQVLRNWLMLHAIRVHVSIFDAMALLIVMFTVGQLPIGPSTGPAATVLILGACGVAAAAAAGVLVTLTGIIGSLLFAAWAAIDRIADRRRGAAGGAVSLAPAGCCSADVAFRGDARRRRAGGLLGRHETRESRTHVVRFDPRGLGMPEWTSTACRQRCRSTGYGDARMARQAAAASRGCSLGDERFV